MPRAVMLAARWNGGAILGRQSNKAMVGRSHVSGSLGGRQQRGEHLRWPCFIVMTYREVTCTARSVASLGGKEAGNLQTRSSRCPGARDHRLHRPPGQSSQATGTDTTMTRGNNMHMNIRWFLQHPSMCLTVLMTNITEPTACEVLVLTDLALGVLHGAEVPVGIGQCDERDSEVDTPKPHGQA
ncbi:hypothetical protein BV20DRAFT_225193 [Pilatotrama ljubarskyi]|nr:hypothetical protein BV20DRAFT_225193 [Pilatotrama ljubarskyi]